MGSRFWILPHVLVDPIGLLRYQVKKVLPKSGIAHQLERTLQAICSA